MGSIPDWIAAVSSIVVAVAAVLALLQYRTLAVHSGKLLVRESILSQLESEIEAVDKEFWKSAARRPDYDALRRFHARHWDDTSRKLFSPALLDALTAAQTLVRDSVKPLARQHEFHNGPLQADSRHHFGIRWMAPKSALQAQIASERIGKLPRSRKKEQKTASTPSAAFPPSPLEARLVTYENLTYGVLKNRSRWQLPEALVAEREIIKLIIKEGQVSQETLDRLAFGYREVYGTNTALRLMPTQIPGNMMRYDDMEILKKRFAILQNGPV